MRFTGTQLRLRVWIGVWVPGGTALSRPEVRSWAIAPKAIVITWAHVGAVGIHHARLTALALLQLRSGVLGAALLGRPVVKDVITLTHVTCCRACTSVVTVSASAWVAGSEQLSGCMRGGRGGSQFSSRGGRRQSSRREDRKWRTSVRLRVGVSVSVPNVAALS